MALRSALALVAVAVAGLVPFAAPASWAAQAPPGVAPVVLDVRPLPGDVRPAGPAVVSARVAGAGDLREAAVLVDGEPLEAGHDGEEIVAAGRLDPGRRTIEVVATDTAGRTARRSWRMTAAEPAVPYPGALLARAPLELASRLRGALEPPPPEPVLTPAPGAELTLPAVLTAEAAGPVDAERSQAYLAVGGAEVPVAVRVEGERLVVDAGVPLPEGPAQEGPAPARLVLEVFTEGADAPTFYADVAYTVTAPDLVATPEGFQIVAGDGPVVGAGPLRTYSLEVEPGLGIDPAGFTREGERLLSDPRGWTAPGDLSLQRVGRPDADIRVVVATPATVDRFCAQAGLDTGGRLSCWNGRFAMLNSERWLGGAEGFAADLPTYRGYLINHEFGHGLGYGHVGCPAPGALAPVMMQQSIDTGACQPNAWPYPDEPAAGG